MPKTAKTTKTKTATSTKTEGAMNKTAKIAKTASAKTATSTTNEPTMTKSESATTTASTQSTPSAAAAPVIFQKAPPADALIPSPPSGFVPSSNSIFTGVLPRLVELGTLPGAIEDLKNFLDYATALGPTAPPIAEAIAAFDLGDQWSSMRKASSIWDLYAQMQEGIAWVTIRVIMDKLRPAFDLAKAHDSSIATKFASLNTLLTAKQSIAKKGVATRALNRQAIAEGKPPIHGKAGKRRKKASDKAIVASATAAPKTAATTAAAMPTATSVTPAPSADAAAPAGSTSPAGSNGAAH